jgi:hypothetical protein
VNGDTQTYDAPDAVQLPESPTAPLSQLNWLNALENKPGDQAGIGEINKTEMNSNLELKPIFLS